ncbi:MAG: c-type cytochrome [Candidatus Bipolaricaulia bacterium]
MSDPEVSKDLWRRIKGPVIFALVGLAVIWGLLPRVSPSWRMHFGVPYLVFFSLATLSASLFFVLLNWGPIRRPGSPFATFVSILFVCVATVGGLVAFGLWYYPQFEIPQPAAEQAEEEETTAAEEQGREVFLAAGCIACHSIEALDIRGGQRGPDLSHVGKQAETRKPGISAEAYLRESIVDPWACFTPLPGSGLVKCQPAADPAKTYPQMMPPGFGNRLTEAQLNDLIAFLKSLKGTQ